MNSQQYDYAVIGGDMRQVYLAEELSGKGNRVICYNLAKTPGAYSHFDDFSPAAATSLEAAVHTSDCVIGPIPLTKDGVGLNQDSNNDPLTISLLVNLLEPGQLFLAGCIPDNFLDALKDKGVSAHDLMTDNFLAVYNTISTAEGAVCEAIKSSPINLHHSSCAILGYGKCGRMLLHYLKGMFCRVSVYSNQEEELYSASTIADRADYITGFKNHAGEFDFIFNTVPARIITSGILNKMRPLATIIDIASAPGGVDYESARSLDICAVHCLGLPGKYSPLSSAKSIKTVVENYVRNFKE